MIRNTLTTLILSATLLTMSMLHGCGDSGNSTAGGTYKYDKIATKAAMQTSFDQIEDPFEKMIAQAVFETIEWTIVLHPDGTLNSTATWFGTQQASGTWELNRGQLTVIMTYTDQAPQRMSGTIRGDKLSISDDVEGMAIRLVFTKQKL